jgi:hypothetical protein
MRYPLICALLFCLSSTALKAQPNFPYMPFLDSDYEIGATYKLFGDDVILRSGPTRNSSNMGVYPVGTEVNILGKSEENYYLYGVYSNWYKVEINGTKGFIVGAFLALEELEGKNGEKILINYELIQDVEDPIPYMIVMRILSGDGYTEKNYKMPNANYYGAKLSGNKGFSAIDQIISLEFSAESCGATGGEMHFLIKDATVVDQFSTFYVSDAGAFSYEETAVFPNDPGGMQDIIIYSEIKEELDNKNIYEISGKRALLKWENSKLTPVAY